jgi:hypothetical protein
MLAQSPRYLLKLLPWIDVPGGTYRINQTKLGVSGRGRVAFEFTDAGPVIEPAALRAIHLFEHMPLAVLRIMLQGLRPLQAARGDVIIDEGGDRDTLFIILNGNVEESQRGERGEDLVVGTRGPGDYFGENDLVADDAAVSTIRATTNCVLLTLAKQTLDESLAAAGLLAQFQGAVQRRLELERASNEYGEKPIAMAADIFGETELPSTYVDFVEEPREIGLSLIQSVLRVHTRVADLYNSPMNQLQIQTFVTTMYMYERQEWELINNPRYGLLSQCAASMRLKPRLGMPTPDDLDAMLARVWKQPSFFLMHPRALEAFLRECTWRGVPPPTVEMHGGKFVTWRGVPLVPSDKVEVNGRSMSRSGPGKTSVILVRAGGEREHGVAGLYQTGIPGEMAPSLSVRLTGIDQSAIASYLMTLYFSLAVHAEDALCVLEDVEVAFHHEEPIRVPAPQEASPPAPEPAPSATTPPTAPEPAPSATTPPTAPEPAPEPPPVASAEPPAPARPPVWRALHNTAGDLAIGAHADGRLLAALRGRDGTLLVASQTAPGANTWSSWQPLADGVQGRPTLAACADGRLLCAGVGADDRLWTRVQTAPNAADWEPLEPHPGAALSASVAVQTAGGRLIVLAFGTDGQLWQRRQGAGSWGTWEPIGGSLSGPSVVVSGERGRLTVFARGQTGELLGTRQSEPGSSQWEAWRVLVGAVTGAPAVVQTADGHIHLFAAAADGSVLHLDQGELDGPLGAAEQLGQAGVGGVAEVAAVAAEDRLMVFARAVDGSLWSRERRAPGEAFGAWAFLTGAARSVTPARNADGRLELFVVETDGSVWRCQERAPGGGWA